MKGSFPVLVYLSLLALLTGSCKNEINLNAPGKEILVVYGILNPKASIQYIRIAKAFQTDGDALVYAANTDLSLQNAEVRLNGQLLEDTVINKNLGEFNPAQVLYYTTQPIQANTYYTLEVKKAGESSPSATAHTYVPGNFEILTPRASTAAAGNLRKWDIAYFERFTKMEWESSGYAKGFECRVYFNYFENNVPKQVVYGPTELFEDELFCGSLSGTSCYQFSENAIILDYKSKMPDGNVYSYIDTPFTNSDTALLNHSCWMEVTAIDSFLYNYISINKSNASTFATSIVEYTNVNGGVGIFGSVNKALRYVDLSQCTRYKLSLNNTPQPTSPPCE